MYKYFCVFSYEISILYWEFQIRWFILFIEVWQLRIALIVKWWAFSQVFVQVILISLQNIFNGHFFNVFT